MVGEKGKQAAVEKRGRTPWTLRELGGKPLWDWLHLLVVPLLVGVLAVVLTAWFNLQQDARQNHIENQRAEAERKLAKQRAQDEALQAYLDQMSGLLLEKDLRTADGDDEVRTLARARTLTVLARLDPSRKKQVLQFLVEAKLVQEVAGTEPIIELGGADLKDADLSGTNLVGAYLEGANLEGADLKDADLSDANFKGANLKGADLERANLEGSALRDADLSNTDMINTGLKGANLRSADLEGANLLGAHGPDVVLAYTNLKDATLTGIEFKGADMVLANLRGANLLGAYLVDAKLLGAVLIGANLNEAFLTGADLTNAEVTQEQLEQAEYLEGATMPNGQKYEAWLKAKEDWKNE